MCLLFFCLGRRVPRRFRLQLTAAMLTAFFFCSKLKLTCTTRIRWVATSLVVSVRIWGEVANLFFPIAEWVHGTRHCGASERKTMGRSGEVASCTRSEKEGVRRVSRFYWWLGGCSDFYWLGFEFVSLNYATVAGGAVLRTRHALGMGAGASKGR